MRVLLTGMSGTGKSAVVGELRRRGYRAVDVDDDGLSAPAEDGRWHWRTGALRQLLDGLGDGPVLVAGCSEEQAQLDWDLRVVLVVPDEVLLQRLSTRTSNPYGRARTEREQVLADRREVEPLLLARADLVLDTRQPLEAVVDLLLARVAAG